MNRATIKQIAERLQEADKILVYPHILMDGDTLGASVALCSALRKAGKEAFVLIEDDIPAYLNLLDQGYCTFDEDIMDSPDISVAVDCSDTSRLANRMKKFFQGGLTINVDHHSTNTHYADLNVVDPHASATGILVYDLIEALGTVMDTEIAEALYIAIATDTGNFQYTNTTKETHLVVAELFDSGIDLEKISVELYQKIRFEKLRITNEIINTIEMLCDGKGNIAYVTQEMLEKTGATLDETEGITETLRNINGVEISCFLKEISTNEIKVSMRAKTYGNVAAIAQEFGGGGHIKAAGCTIKGTMEEAKKLLADAITNHLAEREAK